MARATKSQTVQQLAGILGVSPASIIARCQSEGIDSILDEHSRLTEGLALTIREWMADRQVGTAAPIHPTLVGRREPPLPLPEILRSPLPQNSVVVVFDLDSLWDYASRITDKESKRFSKSRPRAAGHPRASGADQGAEELSDHPSVRGYVFDAPLMRMLLGRFQAGAEQGSAQSTAAVHYVPIFRTSAWASQFGPYIDEPWSLPVFAPEFWNAPDGTRSEAIRCGSAVATASLVTRVLAENKSARVLLISQRFAESELRNPGTRLGLTPWDQPRVTIMHFGTDTGEATGEPMLRVPWRDPAQWPSVIDASQLRLYVFSPARDASPTEILEESIHSIKALIARLLSCVTPACQELTVSRDEVPPHVRNTCRVIVACEIAGYACESLTRSRIVQRDTKARRQPTPAVLRATLMPLALAIRATPQIPEARPLIDACFGLLRRVTHKDSLNIDLQAPMKQDSSSEACHVRDAIMAALVQVSTLADVAGNDEGDFHPLARNTRGTMSAAEIMHAMHQLTNSPRSFWPEFKQRDPRLLACWTLASIGDGIQRSPERGDAELHQRTIRLLVRAAELNLHFLQQQMEQTPGNHRTKSAEWSVMDFEATERLAIRYQALCATLHGLEEFLSESNGFGLDFASPLERTSLKAKLEAVAEAQCGVRTELDALRLASDVGVSPTQKSVFDWLRQVVRKDGLAMRLDHMTMSSTVSLQRSKELGKDWRPDPGRSIR